jgi:hypothetical protein
MKRCSKCGVVKPREDFSRDKSRKDGLQYWCKACINERKRTGKERKREREQRGREEQLRRAEIPAKEAACRRGEVASGLLEVDKPTADERKTAEHYAGVHSLPDCDGRATYVDEATGDIRCIKCGRVVRYDPTRSPRYRAERHFDAIDKMLHRNRRDQWQWGATRQSRREDGGGHAIWARDWSEAVGSDNESGLSGEPEDAARRDRTPATKAATNGRAALGKGSTNGRPADATRLLRDPGLHEGLDHEQHVAAQGRPKEVAQ